MTNDITREALAGKLNRICYDALFIAYGNSRQAGHRHVELGHWIRELLTNDVTDLSLICAHFDCDVPRIVDELGRSLSQLPREQTSQPDFSVQIDEAIENAWVYATLYFNDAQVRSGYLIIGLLKSRVLGSRLLSSSKEFQRINDDELLESYASITESSSERGLAAHDGFELPTDPSQLSGPDRPGDGGALGKYATDFTERARNGEIDPIVGREAEIRQIVDILMSRRQNNPMLTGEAGVGKTAVVEGFAQKIAEGKVPPSLQNVRLLGLDLGRLKAGAGMRGEFETRLKSVIDEVQASETQIVLFIDEAHTLIGAGGAAGTGDAANLLKPALARGELKTIAATTWVEYKKHIEPDPALVRRFKLVPIKEPTPEVCVQMVRSMAWVLEKHHQVQIMDEAIESTVNLSVRYIPARQLPDKAISLLDTACARVGISQNAVPSQIEDLRANIFHLETELDIVRRDRAVGADFAERESAIEQVLNKQRVLLQELEQRWNTEKEKLEVILKLRKKLRQQAGVALGSEVESADDGSADDDSAKDLEDLRNLQAELAELQGESPLVFQAADSEVIANVVEDWTGIPTGRMLRNELVGVLNLADRLKQRVVGQDFAIDLISQQVIVSRSGFDNPEKPIGVYMLCGPSGVGKTETALALAEALFGSEDNLLWFNMSEFQEKHTVSTLRGSPPGYKDSDLGGVMTEAVRRKPYCVILLDEIEKAHKDVQEAFFQVFDKGHMDDARGTRVDFCNTLILLTSNAGSDLILSMCKDPDLMPDPTALKERLDDPLRKSFPSAFLGRLEVVPYYPLSEDVMKTITQIHLRRITDRLQESHGISFTYDPEAVNLIVRRCTQVESGGRLIESILTRNVLPTVSREHINRTINKRELTSIHLNVRDDEFAFDCSPD